MSLVEFEAYGFKSFADRFLVNFDQGITAIVGPNGCGKSNVVDAFRWVLGEQSARQLRGKNMSDLIFSGTDSRKSMSYCEVSLRFNNEKKIFPVAFDEVVISRKLYRSGESEYLVNKTPVRLKDIEAMLTNAGLGKEGYSIIGQGRMDNILNSKPIDRRAIFEEALGISKFRSQKNDTERKLDRTSINIDRLLDSKLDKESRLEPLRVQSVNAKKYLEYREELKYQEVNLYLFNYENVHEAKGKIENKIEGLQDELSFQQKKYDDSIELYETTRLQIADVDQELMVLQEQITDIRVNLERHSGEHNLILERIKAFETQVSNYQSDISQNNNSIEINSCEIESNKVKLIELKNEYNVLISQLNELTNKSNTINIEIENYSHSLKNQTESESELSSDLNEKKNKNALLTNEKGFILDRLVDIDGDLANIESQLGDSQVDDNSYLEYEKNKTEKESLSKKIISIRSEVNEIDKKLSDAKSRLNANNSKRIERKNLLELQRAMADKFEGYGYSVSNLLSVAKSNERLFKCIIGVVGNLLKVSQKYEKAIEIALGGAIQNVVTGNEEDAKTLIRYLKETRGGRVTFLPLTSIKSRTIDNRQVLFEKGILGGADSLVEFDDAYEKVFSSLLGATLIAESQDDAIRVQRKYNSRYRIVTLEGEVFSTQGSITGGNDKTDKFNFLNRERLISQYKSELENLTFLIADAEDEISQLEDEKQGILVDLEESINRLNELNMNIASLEQRFSTSGLLGKSKEQLKKKLIDEKVTLSNRLIEIKNQITGSQEELNKLEEEYKKSQIEKLNSQDTYFLIRQEWKNINDKISDTRIRFNDNTNAINRLSQRNEECLRQIQNSRLVVDEKSVLLENSINAIKSLNEELYTLKNNSALVCELEVIEASVKERSIHKQELYETNRQADEDKNTYQKEMFRISQLISKEEFNIEKIDSELNVMQERIFEDYGLDYQTAVKDKDEEFKVIGAKKEISRLRSSIDRLGNVNVNAIEEYKILKEDFDEISRQLDDLIKAKEDLEAIKLNLTKEIVTRFSAGFQKINENFKETFAEMFQGGRARLIIEENPDKEELDYGIEIEAQPAGKKLQNISLLSGGERALTCIAILFAILKLRPMPFCVLDEIEAALDDSNTQKIAKYIRSFTGETQFIMITHKKPTMENANNLYGVTMQEKGVSRVVSVHLTDAVKNADNRIQKQ